MTLRTPEVAGSVGGVTKSCLNSSIAVVCLEVAEIRRGVAVFGMVEDRVALLWTHRRIYNQGDSAELLSSWAALTEWLTEQKHTQREQEYAVWALSCEDVLDRYSMDWRPFLCGCCYACCPICQHDQEEQRPDGVLAAIEDDDDCWGVFSSYDRVIVYGIRDIRVAAHCLTCVLRTLASVRGGES